MTETTQIVLPKDASDRLVRIAEKYKIPMTQLLQETQKEFNEPYIQNHPILDTADKKYIYATKAVLSNYDSRPTLETFDVIVYGIGRTNTFQSPYTIDTNLLIEVDDRGEAVAKDLHPEVPKSTPKTHLEKARINFKGKDIERVLQIQTSCMYTTNLGRGKAKGILYADDRSLFENPVKVDNITELLLQTGVTYCTIAETPKNLAKEETTSRGTYSDKNDMRIIRGMIGDYRKGGNAGEEWSFYTVTDESLQEDYISPTGEVTVKPAFLVSVNPMWLVYDRKSTCDFVGTLSLNKGSKTKPKPKPYEISMNCVAVLPVISMGEIKQ
jgi:hypothetical protein